MQKYPDTSNNPTPVHAGTAHAISIIGRVRDHNEDSVLVKQWSKYQPCLCGIETLLVVADGMGGHERGEWASGTAVNIVETSVNKATSSNSIDILLKNIFKETNSKVYAGSDNTGQSHPGTTLTVALVFGDSCMIGHVGDSRLYLYRDGYLTQVTEDHSWAAELVRQGQMSKTDADNWEHRNQLTRAVGIHPSVEASIYEIELRYQDVMLLCSDGLTGMISDQDIADIFTASSSSVQAADLLCAAANNAGGEDNISAVVYSHGSWPTGVSRSTNVQPSLMASNQSNSTVASNRHVFRLVSSLLIAVLLLIVGALLILNGTRQRTTTKHTDHQMIQSASARLRIRIDRDRNMLIVESTSAMIHGIAINKETAWDAVKTQYQFNKKTPVSALIDGSASIELQGVRKIKVPFNQAIAWETTVTLPAAFQLYWVGNDPHAIAAFRIQKRE